MSLRKNLIKLANEKPELRKHLLPIIKKARFDPADILYFGSELERNGKLVQKWASLLRDADVSDAIFFGLERDFQRLHLEVDRKVDSMRSLLLRVLPQDQRRVLNEPVEK